METTKLLYFEDTYQFDGNARVLEVEVWEDGRKAIILTQTIFYHQGGGQPYDKGYMEGVSGRFDIEEVRFKDGLVYHIGELSSGQIVRNDHVTLHLTA